MNAAQIPTSNAWDINPVYYKGGFYAYKKNDNWYYDNVLIGCDKVYYITKGSFLFTIDGTVYNAHEGQLFLAPGNTVQSLHVPDGGSLEKYWFHLNLPCEWKPGSVKAFSELVQLPPFIDVTDMEYVANLMRAIVSVEPGCNLAAKLSQKADILRLLSYYISKVECVANLPFEDERVLSVVKYLTEHMSEDISIERLGEVFSMHPNYFIRFFKSKTGYTPHDYIISLRIEAAKRLLLEDTVTVQEVGYQLGFKNMHYFTRLFKQRTGLPPSQYQKLAINKHTVKSGISPPKAHGNTSAS